MFQRTLERIIICGLLCWIIRHSCMTFCREQLPQKKIHFLDLDYNTGDILLVGGGNGIQWVTGTRFIHAAMIYKHSKTQQLFVCHLDIYGGFQQAMTHAHRLKGSSIKLHPLYRYLEKVCSAGVIFRKLYPPYTAKDVPYNTLQDVLFDNCIYVRKWATYWPAILPYLQPPVIKPYVSCDEVIAILYEKMGVFYALHKPLIINHFRQNADHNLPWRSGYKFTEEVYVTGK